jgi:hypothetical protein
MKRLLLFVLLLSGCSNVGWSPNVQEREQPDDTSLYSISITATYPKDQFMSSEEREEYVLLPPHAQDRLMEYYRQREDNKERESEILVCLLQLPPSLEC